MVDSEPKLCVGEVGPGRPEFGLKVRELKPEPELTEEDLL